MGSPLPRMEAARWGGAVTTALWWVLGIVGYLLGGVVFAAALARATRGTSNHLDEQEIGLIALFWVLLAPVVGMYGVTRGLSWCVRKVAGK